MISKIYSDSGTDYLWFWCEGCDTHHRIPVTGIRAWQWNNSEDKPTLKPSIVSTINDAEGRARKICHSYITDGKIQYLNDCTHGLAGQTVDLEDLP